MTGSRGGLLIAVIGDMVDSRALFASARAKAQNQFSSLIRDLNTRFRPGIASKFVITLGDEFQGLLRDASLIPEMVWFVESRYNVREIRLGFGYGKLHTPIQSTALNIDGPVLHQARAAITAAADKKLLGGVFCGFGAYDQVLSGSAQALRYIRSHMTERQRQVVELLRTGDTQMLVAEKLQISKQAVSEHAVAAGWETYKLAEQGWRAALVLSTSQGKRSS